MRRPATSNLPALAIGLALLALATATAIAKPQRIVSLNLCTDQVLVDLVEPERIAGLSKLARDPQFSPIAARAKSLPVAEGHAESVLALAPDLILAGSFTTPETISLLERLGTRVIVVPLATTLVEARSFIMAIGDAVGERARGKTIADGMDERIRGAAASGKANPPSALIYHVNGIVSGNGSLGDEVLVAAGFRNLARDRTWVPSTGSRLDLETLLVAKPDLLILAQAPDAYRSPVADNLRHPALGQAAHRALQMVLPESLLLCGTHYLAAAIERLAAERRKLVP